MWIDPLRAARMDDDLLIVEAPEGIRNWVDSRFGGVIADAAAGIRGVATRIEVTTPGKVVDVNAGSSDSSPGRGSEEAGERLRGPELDPKLTFDRFVISEGNRLAHAASLAAAEMPSQAYNPLFIHGSPGTGKTHLLHAIGNLAKAHTPDLRIRFTTAEDFTARFVDSVRSGETSRFKDRFRDVDLLLVDDAQFLANKTKTEEEFFHTFNTIVNSGSQVVITSDRLPSEIELLAERLRDRFASGLVVDIAPPDLQARMAILAMRVRRDRLGDVPDETLEEIARRVRGNVRSLEGALVRIVAYGSLTGSRVTRELATQVLDQLYPGRDRPKPKATGSTEIKQLVAQAYGLRVEELDSRSRSTRIVWPRQVAMYLAREIAGEPLPHIGSAFGGRNHSTVLNACRRVRERINDDPNEAMKVRSLERQLTSHDDRSS